MNASIVPGTFTTDAPLRDFHEWEHGVHLDFDKEGIEAGVTYHFSVWVKVELTGQEAPPILYKPKFKMAVGLHHDSATGEGYKIGIPTEMLPDNVSYASASTNVSNAWLIKRHNHVFAELREVVELVGPRAEFGLYRWSVVWTEKDSIASDASGYVGYWLGIHNKDDTSDTILGNLSLSVQVADIKIKDVHHEQYAAWDETSVTWTFPPEYILYERWDEGCVHLETGFDTDHTEKLNMSLNRWMDKTEFHADGYQKAEFSVTSNSSPLY